MEKLLIQPGNLCQFLPQDVVRDFPQMTHQEIFYNTIKVGTDWEAYGRFQLLLNFLKTKRRAVDI